MSVKEANSGKMKQAKVKKPSFFRNALTNWQLWAMLLPAIVLVFIFNYIPMYGIQLAFREFEFSKGLTGGEFVGFKYFIKFFESYQFGNLIGNTFVLCFSTLIFSFPIPIILALMMNQIRSQGAKKTMQTVLYAPHFISTVVMVGLINVLLSPNNGIFGKAITSIFGDGINLLGMPSAFVPVYVISDIWQHAGWNSVIYLAALSSVDPQLYDACKVDGAGKWKSILHVDIPTLVPTMLILLILNMGNVLNVGFEKAFLMQNDLNIGVSELISTYVYKIGIRSNQYSYSAAIGLFNTLINFVMLITMNTISKKVSDTSLW